jgi:hypothetical protein
VHLAPLTPPSQPFGSSNFYIDLAVYAKSASDHSEWCAVESVSRLVVCSVGRLPCERAL